MKFKAFSGKTSLLLLAIATFAVYANALSNGFVSDDITGIVNNLAIKKTWNIPIGIPNILFSLLFRSFGPNAAIFHLHSIFWHILVTLAAYACVRTLSKRNDLAFLTSLLFGIHPVHTEAVAFISDLPYLLYSFFSLLTLTVVLWKSQNQMQWKWMAVATLTAMLAFLSSEKAVVLPFLLVMALLLFRSWKTVLALWPIGLAWIVYLVFPLMNRLPARIQTVSVDPSGKLAVSDPFLIFPIAIANYLKLSIYPINLSLYHEDFALYRWQLNLYTIVTIGWLVVTIMLAKVNRVLFFFALFFFIALSPLLLPFNLNWFVAERYMYLASFGLVGIAAYLLLALKKWQPLFFWIAVSVVVLFLGAGTVKRNQDWYNEDTLWLATVAASPTSSKAHVNIGAIKLRKGDVNGAITSFEQAARLNPSNPEPWNNLGYIFFTRGEYEKAQAYVEKALSLNSNVQVSVVLLARIHLARGNLDLAQTYLNKALSIDAKELTTYRILAELYMVQGKKTEARELLTNVLAANPKDTEAEELLKTLK